MALMQIDVIPLGTGSTSIGEFVAGIMKTVARAGVVCKLTDMGTLIEGEAEDLLKIAALIHESPFSKGVKRVVTHISIDDRRDKKVGIGDKVDSVNGRLNLENNSSAAETE